MTGEPCPFCHPEASRVFYEGARVLGLWDGFPVNPGHALLVPRRHVADWFVADDDERAELLAALERAREAIVAQRAAEGAPAPDGFNIGINVGAAAGQTVFHLHVHVIPRYTGDVDDPRGGVRHVIPAKGNYRRAAHDAQTAADTANTAHTGDETDVHERATREVPIGDIDAVAQRAKEQTTRYLSAIAPAVAAAVAPARMALRDRFGRTLEIDHPEMPPRLVHGDDDPLLPELTRALAQAVRADIAVAFVKPSGIGKLREHLADFLAPARPGALPPGRLRLLAGDYLDLTDPAALRALGDLTGDVHLRIFETAGRPGFHPKAWIFHRADGSGLAFVGSSNLSAPALTSAVEWNYRLVSSDESGFASVTGAFEALFAHAATRPLDDAWIDAYTARRQPCLAPAAATERPDVAVAVDDDADVDAEPMALPQPHDVQREALAALSATRAAGNGAGLVVLATGLGKTWLAAFDSVGADRVLFVAHRDEILTQARATFRRLRPHSHLGSYTGNAKDPGADVLFASIQTLGRAQHLRAFAKDAFDYIVVDEFHHAAARTYRQLLDYFTPRFLLGLTATPERTDGGDLLTLCDGNLVYRADLGRGIGEGLLCPFRYFGVPDDVDYAHIPWRSTRFDEAALTDAVATQERAQNALEQLRDKAPGDCRALVFCCSTRHADFMASFLNEQGLHAAAVHSGPTSDARADSLERLSNGQLQAICAVDLFNEGVDIPEIDTVMMLRPTESAIVWLQQLGRGLRWREGKRLTVIDYIGNHRTFLHKPLTLLAAIGQPQTDLTRALSLLRDDGLTGLLPPGCEVTYELEVVDVLQKIVARDSKASDRLKAFYDDFTERFGQRPRAAQAYREGHNPKSLKKTHGSWLEFVASLGGLSESENAALKQAKKFLRELETTGMSKSYKMVLLDALLDEDAFPGRIELDRLTQAFARRARRSAKLTADIGGHLDDTAALAKMLERNPINAWTGGNKKKGEPYFSYDAGVFATNNVPADLDLRAQLVELVRELVEWRLAEYLDRESVTESESVEGEQRYVIKVNHNASGQPILFPLDRKKHPGLPSGWTEVLIDGERYEAKFVKVAVNVVRRVGQTENVLDEVLRGWFGDEAGASGSAHFIELRSSASHDWSLRRLA